MKQAILFLTLAALFIGCDPAVQTETETNTVYVQPEDQPNGFLIGKWMISTNTQYFTFTYSTPDSGEYWLIYPSEPGVKQSGGTYTVTDTQILLTQTFPSASAGAYNYRFTEDVPVIGTDTLELDADWIAGESWATYTNFD